MGCGGSRLLPVIIIAFLLLPTVSVSVIELDLPTKSPEVQDVDEKKGIHPVLDIIFALFVLGGVIAIFYGVACVLKKSLGRYFIIIIILIFVASVLIQPVSAVEVIKREKPAEPPKGIMSPMQGVLDFVSAWWMPLLIGGGIFFILMYVLRWWKSQREKANIFLLDYNRTRALCKHQANRKRINEKAIWFYVLAITIFLSVLLFVVALITDDVPSFLLAIGVGIAGIVASAFLKLAKFFAQFDIVQVAGSFGTKIIGYYLGECITSEGYRNFLCWNRRKFIFWKNEFIVKVNLNADWKIETWNPETKQREIRSFNLPTDLIIEGENAIILKGEGLDVAGYYYYPIMTDTDGNIVNMDLIAFARSRDVAMLDTLYQQTEDFVRVQREAINLNPNVRYTVRTRGESVEAGGQGT